MTDEERRAKAAERSRRYRARHPERKADYFQKNKEAIYTQRKSRPQLKEQQRGYSAKYRAANREKIAAYREKNREKIAEYHRRLRAERIEPRAQPRRARIRDRFVEHVDRFVVFERDGWICGICQDPIDPTAQWPDPMSASHDHIVPIARDGVHSYANSQAAHLICNMRKSNLVVGG